MFTLSLLYSVWILFVVYNVWCQFSVLFVCKYICA